MKTEEVFLFIYLIFLVGGGIYFFLRKIRNHTRPNSMRRPPEIKAYLRKKFPELEQEFQAPTLYRINGIGFTLLGKRDLDVETNSYVATQYVTFLFIPLFPIAAFRVVDSGRGWNILGKVCLNKTDIGPKRLANNLATGIFTLLGLFGALYLIFRLFSVFG